VATSETPARDAVLVKYLNEAYGKEQQLETALKAQIALAQRPQLKKGLQEHLKVTKAQSRGLKKRIKELGGAATAGMDLPGPHLVSDVATAGASVVNKAMATAKGPVQALRGTSPADNQLRQIRDCLWNEAEEIAHYHVIEATAEALGDKETAKLARTYRGEEEKMQRLLERQIAPLVKEVIKEEVPAAERRPATARRKPAARSTTTSASASRSATSGRRTATRSASSRSTTAGRRAAAKS
jgi:ferritin-like metal-binding protein YciE